MVTELPSNVPTSRLLKEGPFLSNGFKKIIKLGRESRDKVSGKKKGAEVTEPSEREDRENKLQWWFGQEGTCENKMSNRM